MKKIFFAALLLAALEMRAPFSNAADWPVKMDTETVQPSPVSGVPAFTDAAPATSNTDSQTASPVMVVLSPVPVIVYPQTAYVPWPVVTFGFGFGHPYVSGYYRGNYGRVNFRNRR